MIASICPDGREGAEERLRLRYRMAAKVAEMYYQAGLFSRIFI
ncbi:MULTISPECIES: hypothetical protein [Bacillus]|nr:MULTISPECIES: hypothetical protein [Bacillus]MDU0069691.1 hypothetical protein [Bacillus sp. IG6]MED8017978.1 hypothetical protein [Bacillus glycinifermentans]WKB79449.1 hypothetical protein QYM22_11640 [Bacillus glycinifermentans]